MSKNPIRWYDQIAFCMPPLKVTQGLDSGFFIPGVYTRAGHLTAVYWQLGPIVEAIAASDIRRHWWEPLEGRARIPEGKTVPRSDLRGFGE